MRQSRFVPIDQQMRSRDDGRDDPIDIECTIERDDPDKAGIAIWDGESRFEKVNPTTGEIKEYKKWTWIPRSKILGLKMLADGKSAIITIPTWLAKDRGLVNEEDLV